MATCCARLVDLQPAGFAVNAIDRSVGKLHPGLRPLPATEPPHFPCFALHAFAVVMHSLPAANSTVTSPIRQATGLRSDADPDVCAPTAGNDPSANSAIAASITSRHFLIAAASAQRGDMCTYARSRRKSSRNFCSDPLIPTL